MSRLGEVPPPPAGRDHLAMLRGPLDALDRDIDRIDGWGRHLTDVLLRGGRLLAAGNGGSAAQVQHLTSELVGRYRDDRPPLSAIALHAETSAVTAIGNDYGYDDVFARQLLAHGRPGDVFIGLSTSGTSANILRAAEAARAGRITVWALTGAPGSALAELADEAVCVDAPATATVQEVHQVVVHLLCARVEREIASRLGPDGVVDLSDPSEVAS